MVPVAGGARGRRRRTVKASEGIVPTEFSEAGGRSGVLIPVDRVAVADNRVLQVQPVGTGVQSRAAEAASLGADVEAEPLATQPLCVKLTVPLKKVVPPNSSDVIETVSRLKYVTFKHPGAEAQAANGRSGSRV